MRVRERKKMLCFMNWFIHIAHRFVLCFPFLFQWDFISTDLILFLFLSKEKRERDKKESFVSLWFHSNLLSPFFRSFHAHDCLGSHIHPSDRPHFVWVVYNDNFKFCFEFMFVVASHGGLYFCRFVSFVELAILTIACHSIRFAFIAYGYARK